MNATTFACRNTSRGLHQLLSDTFRSPEALNVVDNHVVSCGLITASCVPVFHAKRYHINLFQVDTVTVYV